MSTFTATFTAKQNSWYVADETGECVSGLYDEKADAEAEAVELQQQAEHNTPAENGLIVASARSRGWDRGHTAAAAGGDRDALAEETATNLYPDLPQLHRECADAFRLAWDARLSQ